MNEGAIGTCDICGKENVPLTRTDYKYEIKCECHSPYHLVTIFHCAACVLKEPETTRIKIKTSELRRLEE